MKKNEFTDLVQKYLDGRTTREEEESLIRFYESFQQTEVWPEELGPKEEIKKKIYGNIKNNLSHEKGQRSNTLMKRAMGYVAVAVVVIGAIFLYRASLTTTAVVPENGVDAVVDANQVTLKLANGNVEVLTSDGNRKIYDSEGNEVVSNNKGQLDYSKAGATEELAYNELNVPFGKRFDLILSDGTKVKLNAGTWLRYPVTFLEGQNRKIFFKGEAYFDVMEDSERPFIVNMDNLSVEVLGTEFNMSFFPEDQTANTVLVEGRVSIYQNGQQTDEESKTYLEPGQLAAWSNGTGTMNVSEVDTSIYTAWKDGVLLFKNASFEDIAKKLERYMDIRIVNEYDFLDEERFTASFDEEETIGNILEYFNEDTPFDYSIKDNIITIEPKQ